PEALLVSGGEAHRLVIGGTRVAGVHHADRRDVHGGAAVDHVADTALPRLGARQLQALENPLLRVEQPFDEHRLALQLGHEARRPGDLPHEAVGHVPGIEVAPRFGVDLHQAERHQRVVGGDAVEHGPDAALEVASAVVGGHLSTVLAYSVMCVLPAALNSSTNCGHWSIVASPVMNLATHE